MNNASGWVNIYLAILNNILQQQQGRVRHLGWLLLVIYVWRVGIDIFFGFGLDMDGVTR